METITLGVAVLALALAFGTLYLLSDKYAELREKYRALDARAAKTVGKMVALETRVRALEKAAGQENHAK